jgi:hypothetical protein
MSSSRGQALFTSFARKESYLLKFRLEVGKYCRMRTKGKGKDSRKVEGILSCLHGRNMEQFPARCHDLGESLRSFGFAVASDDGFGS